MSFISAISGPGYPKAVEDTGDALVVRLPILVAPGASLVISGLDARRIYLSADAGSFIVNAGQLYIIDAGFTVERTGRQSGLA